MFPVLARSRMRTRLRSSRSRAAFGRCSLTSSLKTCVVVVVAGDFSSCPRKRMPNNTRSCRTRNRSVPDELRTWTAHRHTPLLLCTRTIHTHLNHRCTGRGGHQLCWHFIVGWPTHCNRHRRRHPSAAAKTDPSECNGNNDIQQYTLI